MVTGLFTLLFGLLGLVAGIAFARHLRAQHALRRRADALSDDAIRAIEAHGRVEVDEPLDMDEIREEEERFWEEEQWDESDEW